MSSPRSNPTSVAPGLLVVDKPGGMTSHDVVGRVRRLAGTRKVGHAGTLDPMATGVLVVGVGRATRLLGHLTLTEKAYDATIELGVTTSTDDAEGEVLHTSDTSSLTAEAVREAVAGFVGEIDQVPSSVSAVKVDGRRAYDRVRAGEQVELAARRVRIEAIDVHRVDLPAVHVSVHCSSGTYIRALARDLGAALGVGGHLTALRRTRVGPFALTDALTLEELAVDYRTLPLEAAVPRAFRTVVLGVEQAAEVRVGRRLSLDLDRGAPVAMLGPDGSFLALYEHREPGIAQAVAVFADK